MIRPEIIKNIAEEIPQVNDLANAYEACCARNETVKNELTRLLLHLAPDVEPENDIVSVFWQVDNAVCGLLKESRPTQLAPDAKPAGAFVGGGYKGFARVKQTVGRFLAKQRSHE